MTEPVEARVRMVLVAIPARKLPVPDVIARCSATRDTDGMGFVAGAWLAWRRKHSRG